MYFKIDLRALECLSTFIPDKAMAFGNTLLGNKQWTFSNNGSILFCGLCKFNVLVSALVLPVKSVLG